MGTSRRRPVARADREADRSMRVDQLAGGVQRRGDGGRDFGLVGAAGGEQRRRVGRRASKPPACAKPCMRARARAASPPSSSSSRRSKLLATWMSIDGLEVATTAAALVAPCGEEAGEDVVLVGGDHQPRDRQPDRRGDPAGIDVAEIAGGHANATARSGAPRRSAAHT